MKKLLVLGLILFSCVEKYEDPMEEHFHAWESVVKSIRAQKPQIKECKKSVELSAEYPAIYFFNIKEQKITDFKQQKITDDKFKEDYIREHGIDGYKEILAKGDANEALPASFHDCIERSLQSAKLSIKKDQSLMGGSLLITKDEEAIKAIQY